MRGKRSTRCVKRRLSGPSEGRVKERGGTARASRALNREKTKYEISTYIAILPDYKGFDWVFATNTEYGKIFSYVRYYKKRWGIETTGKELPKSPG